MTRGEEAPEKAGDENYMTFFVTSKNPGKGEDI